MKPKKRKWGYAIAIVVVNILVVLMYVGTHIAKTGTTDAFIQSIGAVIGSFFIGLLVWPLVWLFKRKSVSKWEIACVIGSILNLIVTTANFQ